MAAFQPYAIAQKTEKPPLAAPYLNAQYDIVAARESDPSQTADWRRLRLGAKGTLGNYLVKTEFDISDPRAISPTDFYFDIPLGEKLELRFGQQKTPNSLDEQTSSSTTSVTERAALTNAFELDRRLGVVLHQSGTQHKSSIGIFGPNLSHSGFSNDVAVSARWLRWNETRSGAQTHIGVSGRVRAKSDSDSTFDYTQRAFSRFEQGKISTRAIGKRDIFLGAETAWIGESIWLASEYGALGVDCARAAQCRSRLLHGGYVEAGFSFRTPRGYSAGAFKSHRKSGHRAALRFDFLDLGASATERRNYMAVVGDLTWSISDRISLRTNLYTTNLPIDSGQGLAVETPRKNASGMTVRLQASIG